MARVVAPGLGARRGSLPFDRGAVVPLKVALIAQQARLHAIKQRPQLAEVILDGRPGQSQPVLGA